MQENKTHERMFYYFLQTEKCGPLSLSELSALWDQGLLENHTPVFECKGLHVFENLVELGYTGDVLDLCDQLTWCLAEQLKCVDDRERQDFLTKAVEDLQRIFLRKEEENVLPLSDILHLMSRQEKVLQHREKETLDSTEKNLFLDCENPQENQDENRREDITKTSENTGMNDEQEDVENVVDWMQNAHRNIVSELGEDSDLLDANLDSICDEFVSLESMVAEASGLAQRLGKTAVAEVLKNIHGQLQRDGMALMFLASKMGDD